jgi:hypothetical protein
LVTFAFALSPPTTGKATQSPAQHGLLLEIPLVLTMSLPPAKSSED